MGDATGLLILGSKAEIDLSVLDNPGNEEEIALFNSIKSKLENDSDFYSRIKSNIIGVTEETTTGVARLYQLQKQNALPYGRGRNTEEKEGKKKKVAEKNRAKS